MATVGATEFKARCLELMDRVAEERTTYIITKRGRPVAKLVPADPPKERDLFGCLADRTVYVGDVERPLWTEDDWRAFERHRALQWRAKRHGSRDPGRVGGRRAGASGVRGRR